jgi:membrane-associated phospholipid phosphatase
MLSMYTQREVYRLEHVCLSHCPYERSWQWCRSLVEIEEKAEKGLLSLSSHGDRFAYWLSQITSPFVVGMALLGYISLETAPSVTQALQWLTLISVGLAMPYGFIWWGVKRGKVTDIHVSRRSERLLPLVVGLMALCGMLVGLVMLDASRPVVATLVAILTSFALAALITQLARFKMSLHVDSAAGALIVCCLLVSPLFLVLSPLVVLIAWARYKLEAHFPLQAVCGAALAVAVTANTFWFFGLR